LNGGGEGPPTRWGLGGQTALSTIVSERLAEAGCDAPKPKKHNDTGDDGRPLTWGDFRFGKEENEETNEWSMFLCKLQEDLSKSANPSNPTTDPVASNEIYKKETKKNVWPCLL
jgi:hypothetical protein